MSAIIINGTQIATELKETISRRVQLLAKKNIIPTLAVVLVGNDPASQIYVNNKKKSAGTVGINSTDIILPENITSEELKQQIDRLNHDDNTHAILIQLPLPRHLDSFEAISWIAPEKDVDCFHPVNAGKLSYNKAVIAPCTPTGIVHLIESTKTPTQGKHAVIIGRSNVVGRPLAQLLLNKDCSVTIVHSKTNDLARICATADILVSAVGRRGLVTADFVKKDAIVIDVGITRDADNKVAGDVCAEEVAEIAAALTPVPKGVGPMTIAYLLYNTLILAELRAQ